MSVSLTPPMFLQFFVPGTNQPAVGYQLFTYIAGTSTKQATWTDSTQLTQSANPLIADANGVVIFWVDPTLSYKYVLAARGDTDPPTSPIYSVDNISPFLTGAALTAALIGSILYPRTAAEIAASVTPVNYAYAPGNALRYGADPTNTNDSGLAIQTAWRVNGAVTIPPGVYAIKSLQTFNGQDIGLFGASINTTTLVFTGAGGFIFGDVTNVVRNQWLLVQNINFSGNNRGQATTAIKMYSFSSYWFTHCLFFEIQGSAIYAEQTYDGAVEFCDFQTCGDNAALGAGHSNAPVIYLPYISSQENNHWDIIGNHFESSYWIDLFCSGASNECDHFITKNKFGVPSYTIASATDTGQYHIYCLNTVGPSIVDNWFFDGGVAYMSNCVAYKIQGNHARFVSQGIWDDGGGGSTFLIQDNHIYGNGSSNSTTGSLSTGHWGIRVGGQNATVGPGNDVFAFNVDYQMWTGATNILLNQPVVGGANPATVAAGTLNDGGTGTRIQQLDQLSVALPLANSWVSAGFATPSYSRIGNWVAIKGLVGSGTITTGTVIGTLPAGFRPPDSNRFFIVATDNGTTNAPGFLNINTSGQILIGAVPVGTTHISLEIGFTII